MVKTVFLDLDDTILDFRRSEAAAISRTLAEAGLEATPAVVARYHEINKRHWELLEEGKITRQQVLLHRFDRLFGEFGMECDSAAIWKTYEGYLSQGHFMIPGAMELLETIAPKYDLYLASNGASAVQNPRLDAAGIRKFFKGFFISEKMGADKPSRAYFDLCFAAIPDFDPAKAVIVGDSLTSDIRGGRNAGIRTCWFNPHHQPARSDIPADYEFHDLSELPALLEGL